MVDEGCITQAEADEAKAIRLAQRIRGTNSIAPYFTEKVRQQYQAAANQAVSHDLRTLDKRHGFRSPDRNVLDEGGTLEEFGVKQQTEFRG